MKKNRQYIVARPLSYEFDLVKKRFLIFFLFLRQDERARSKSPPVSLSLSPSLSLPLSRKHTHTHTHICREPNVMPVRKPWRNARSRRARDSTGRKKATFRTATSRTALFSALHLFSRRHRLRDL